MTITTLINKKKLLSIVPLSEKTIYNLEQRGEFPRRIALTSRNVAWELSAVEEWINQRKESGEKAIRPGRSAIAP
ncbi:MAG: AlpA family phage regulatory protein [Gammaproteobacteria bacterium]|nr:MAG: AlpA family phage regulatory protein [Gammaproteobacteria bacterium]